ncbi:MAG TPA: extracellular solute-binding protein [Nitrososphaerales archaeon]|nr:extracellular solute-binding protein [Nitrososphaerales archaeon]
MRVERGVSTTVVVGVVVLIVIVAAGAYVALSPPSKSSTTSSTSSSTTMSTASSMTSSSTSSTNPDAALYQLALKEGSLVIYGSPTAQQFANVTAAFNATYPGISIQYVPLQPPQAVPRITSELAAQNYSADIAFQAATAIYPLEQQGDAISYVSPFASSFPSAVLDPLDESTPIIEIALGWVYNTQMIQPANVPTTMAQVANSQFKGEVVMNDPTTGTAFTQYWATLSTLLGNSTIHNFLSSVKNVTSPTILPTTTSCAGDVGRGAHAICLGAYMQEVAPDVQAGQPLRFLNITGLPLLITPSNSMIVKNAQHPNAAKLFTDFMASPAGQVAWGNVNVRTPVTPDVAAKWSLNSELKSFDPGYGTLAYFPSSAVASAASAWGKTFMFMKA